MGPRCHRVAAAVALTIALGILAAGCADPTVGTIGGKVRVVAAENFWGSIARQLGGAHAEVQSLIVNPAQDPHSYEPTTGDARAMATAQLAIVNDVGYDPWAPKLLAANPVNGRVTLSVGRLFGLSEGENPHRWYDPADVTRVARTIAADLQRLDPPHRHYFAQRLSRLDGDGLAGYHRLIAQIRARYRGVAVGASESIFALQAPALGLDLITPPGFMKAISEGTEVTAQDTITTERQLAEHRIKVWVYNSQNVTPEIERLNRAARAAGIPTVTVTETLSPASDSFQQWQVAQLTRLRAALHQATGR
jgi:zinc/manganese transport system substrate-binding protein